MRPPSISLREANALAGVLDSTAAVDAADKAAEVQRVISMMDPAMSAACLSMHEEEVAAIARVEGLSVEAVMDRRLRETYSKVGISTLRTARYALTRVADFGASLGLAPPRYGYSVGLVSAFLAGQTAPSMPARLLSGLEWAAGHMGADIDASSPFLAQFHKRHHGGYCHLNPVCHPTCVGYVLRRPLWRMPYTVGQREREHVRSLGTWTEH